MKFPFPKRKIVTEATQSFTFSRRAMVVGGLQGAIGAVLVGTHGLDQRRSERKNIACCRRAIASI